MRGVGDTTTAEASEMTRDETTSTSANPSSSTQHTSADVAPELFESSVGLVVSIDDSTESPKKR